MIEKGLGEEKGGGSRVRISNRRSGVKETLCYSYT